MTARTTCQKARTIIFQIFLYTAQYFMRSCYILTFNAETWIVLPALCSVNIRHLTSRALSPEHAHPPQGSTFYVTAPCILLRHCTRCTCPFSLLLYFIFSLSVSLLFLKWVLRARSHHFNSGRTNRKFPWNRQVYKKGRKEEEDYCHCRLFSWHN